MRTTVLFPSMIMIKNPAIYSQQWTILFYSVLICHFNDINYISCRLMIQSGLYILCVVWSFKLFCPTRLWLAPLPYNTSVLSIPLSYPQPSFFHCPRPCSRDYYQSTRPQSVTVSSWVLGSGWTMTVWGTPAGPAARRLPSWWLTTSPWRQTRSSGPPVAGITSPASWSESAYQISANHKYFGN